MRKLIFIPIFLFGFLFLLSSVRGQDPNYSQFFSTPLYYNPAYTGINTGVRARFTFRDQWPNLPVDFRSYYFSADLGDRNLPGSGGLGLIVNSDNEGLGLLKISLLVYQLASGFRSAQQWLARLGLKPLLFRRV